MKIDGWVADVDSVCGNGIEWAVHWFHRHGMTELSRGSIANGDRETFSIEEPLQIQRGDLVRLIISPKDKSHVCDTTQIELKIQGLSASDPKWTLSSEIVDRIHEGNPLSDHYGNADVWHFCRSDSESKDSAVSVIHPSSRIASYLQPNGENRQEELREITDSLLKPNNPSDTITANHLKSLAGPFPWLQLASEEVVSSSPATALKQRSPSVRKYRIPLKSQKRLNLQPPFHSKPILRMRVASKSRPTPSPSLHRLNYGPVIWYPLHKPLAQAGQTARGLLSPVGPFLFTPMDQHRIGWNRPSVIFVSFSSSTLLQPNRPHR